MHHVEPSVKFLVSLEGGALRVREARRKLGVCELLLPSTPGNQLTLNSWVVLVLLGPLVLVSLLVSGTEAPVSYPP